MTTQAQRQFLVTIDGLDGKWAQRTGGEGQSEVQRVYNGGDDTAEILTGPVTYTDMVLTRPYDRLRDGSAVSFLLARQGKWWTSISQVATDENLVATGGPGTWRAKLIRVKLPEVNASSAAASEIALTFAVQSAA